MPNDDIIVRAKEWVDALKQYSMAAPDIELISDLLAELEGTRLTKDAMARDMAELRAELTKARQEITCCQAEKSEVRLA